MTPEELYQLVGHQDVLKDIDVKTMVLDIIREQATHEEVMVIFWKHLEKLDEEYVKGYFYRRFSS